MVQGPQTRFQCVCGAEVPCDLTESYATCQKCNRVLRPTAQTSLALDQTIIGDFVAEAADDLPVGPGDHLAHFTILDRVGSGGMGAVFRARDESLLRYVALKVIKGRQDGRLVEEARAQARMRHPNIVRIYYVGEHLNLPFLAMELVDGQSLEAVMAERRLPFSEIVRVARQTASALAHSVDCGIIHGDVKPANLILESNGTVQLSDFGLATARVHGDDLTNSGPMGTPNYMAPEVAAGQHPDEVSDVYSFGVMLYEMTFGKVPGAGTSTLMETLENRREGEISFPKEWPADRPERWRAFLESLLHKDRSRRPQSHAELLQQLQDWDVTAILPANRMQRAISWMIDTAASMSAFGLVAALSDAIRDAVGVELDFVGGVFVFVPVVAILWYSVKRRRTPGKTMLQLKTVDEFGISPPIWKLWIKYVVTFWPVLYVCVIVTGASIVTILVREVIDLNEWYFAAIPILAGIFWIVNCLWMLVLGGRQTLIDRLLRLQVTLHTGNPGRATETGANA